MVNKCAAEDCDLPSTAKFQGKVSSSGKLIVRDAGHRGMSLGDFCANKMATAAELTQAEVAALRLYSGELWAACKRHVHVHAMMSPHYAPFEHAGPLFAPLNRALRSEKIAPWATRQVYTRCAPLSCPETACPPHATAPIARLPVPHWPTRTLRSKAVRAHTEEHRLCVGRIAA